MADTSRVHAMLALPPSPRSSPAALLAAALIAAPAAAPTAAGQTARYRLTIDNTWSATTHPGAFPFDAHFSWLGGGTHDATVSFWNVGTLASPGVKDMAESGSTILLEDEVALAVANGTMLGPSPDWFVGVSGLPLHDGSDWIARAVVDLRPFDAGTRDNNLFELWGPETQPPEPLMPITAASGQLIGPDSLGSFTFTRIGRIVDLCQGLAGTFAPVLDAEGSLLPDELVTVTTSGLPPASATWMFLGIRELAAPFLAGVLVPDPLITLVLPTGNGTLVMSGVMPSAVPAGAEILLQAWAPDAGGPAGACASNALALLLP